MGKKVDSKALFFTQMKNHADVLSGLLGVGSNEAIPLDTIERCRVSTNMLSSSAQLMNLVAWADFLSAFETLLQTYRDKRLPWDEKIAQLASELIEVEEQVAGSSGKKGVGSEEMQGLSLELEALLDAAMQEEAQEETQEAVGEEVEEQAADEAPVETRKTPKAAKKAAKKATKKAAAGTSKSADADIADAMKSLEEDRESGDLEKTDRPLGRIVGGLIYHTKKLLTEWDQAGFEAGLEVAGSQPQAATDNIRRELCLIDFYALAAQQIIDANSTGPPRPLTCSLTPVRIAVEESARTSCADGNRRLDVSFLGEELEIDARLLYPMKRVLRHLIGDVFIRCDDQYIRVEVDVEEKDGAILCTLRDNGNNFLTDSRLDPEDFLAFYPGLKAIRRVLSGLSSLLWVEPDENHDTRFAFTIPLSLETSRFVVWGKGKSRFAVLSTQLDDIYSSDEVEVQSDGLGDFLMIGGKRVPVMNLSQYYSGAPGDGNHIAVIGFLEKRVAFVVDGEGSIEEGTWLRDAVPIWKGLDRGVASIQDEKIPLVEADSLLDSYLKFVGGIGQRDFSGGVVGETTELSHSTPGGQAAAGLPHGLPPEARSDSVLIVERSESLRKTLADILSNYELEPKMVSDIDEAVAYIAERTPRLIISDFRMPSLSAKVLAERLKAQGKSVPVLVTTSHRGANADLLVQKLGVSGYLSKPLNADEVLSRISEYLRDEPAGAPPG